eukprot:GHVU01114443.1.p1 GENE.GHVU01114443.1~~GHVU01114443.1.p1  ORF type:complete len:244 (+),score=56.90 GHVU01114443.1:1482-2213(+)
MTELNPRAVMGANMPPDPLDEAIATDAEALELAEGILTGAPVTSREQMDAVDAIAKRLKAVKKAVTTAKESESKPLHDAWKQALARYKPTEDDIDRQVKGCVAMVDTFKRQLAAEKAEAERQARAEADAKAKAAHEAAMSASVSDIDAQRAAAQAKLDAEDAAKAARAATKEAATIKGMRTVTRYAFTEPTEAMPRGGMSAALNWIAKNDADALAAFVDDYVRRNHKGRPIDGVRVWTEKEAY